ncbi:unnamed protein product, partial [Amoebophrya sp. A25]
TSSSEQLGGVGSGISMDDPASMEDLMYDRASEQAATGHHATAGRANPVELQQEGSSEEFASGLWPPRADEIP